MVRSKSPLSSLVIPICTAQFLTSIGTFFWPALLPKLAQIWSVNSIEAGWITSIFYGTYLVSGATLLILTDKYSARNIYLFGLLISTLGYGIFFFAQGFWSAMVARAITGLGAAGTYMIGLKLLTDRVESTFLSRATALNVTVVGASASLSFASGDLIARLFGWQFAFLVAALSGVIALLIAAAFVERLEKSHGHKSTFDLRAVFRNQPAMTYAGVYAFHCFEMNALRGWAVAFLAFVAAESGQVDPTLSPAIVATIAGLLGTGAGFVGNEIAIRIGRVHFITCTMIASMLISAVISIGRAQYDIAVGLLIIYSIAINADASSLTAGTAGLSDPERRGATLAVHSTLGYAGGFLGPLAVGIMLEWGGWALAFQLMAVLGAITLMALRARNPPDLVADRAKKKQAG